MRARANRYLSDVEAKLLLYELSLASGPRSIKRGLQNLCMYYERGRKLSDPTNHRQLIHRHLSSDDVLLRRWSIKALGLIADRGDSARIVRQLRVEADAEAQSWGVAALLKIADDRSMRDVCHDAGLESSAPLLLAARLYASTDWIDRYWKPVSISIHADDLTLKWAIFLAGYGKAPEELFDPRHKNQVFLGELNQHDTPEISEYSIWALWERPDFGISYLTIPLDRVRKHPANARKWLYRLYLKEPVTSGLDPNALKDFRKDDSVSAREGLALGVVDIICEGFDSAILDWYDDEDDVGIRNTLLTAMAKRSKRNQDFADEVQRQFKRIAPDNALRPKLLAASEGTALFQRLKKIELDSEYALQGLLQFAPTVNIEGDVTMTSFNAGRDMMGQNLVGGDMTSSANGAVQSIGAGREHDKVTLEAVLDFLKGASLPQAQKDEVATAVQAAATETTAASKTRLLDTLNNVVKSVVAAGSTVAHLDEIIGAIRNWIN